jgi:excisionase family DNA binding protein
MLREEREPIDRNSGELLTIDELAAHLKVAKSWIYTHTHARTKPRLPSIKLGKYLRFRLPEVYAYLETLRRV